MLTKMFTNITDTHAHYNSEAFADDMDTVLTSLPDAGIFRIINCGTTPETSMQSRELSRKYSYIYFAAGIHPEDCETLEKNSLEIIKSLLTDTKCVAVGEIGLDYHFEPFSKEKQKYFFEEQIKIALDFNLPVIIHDRDAHGDTIELLKKYKPKGVLHCYSGSLESARELIKIGMYIGLGGAVTFKNAKRAVEVAEKIPEDRLLLETDCPYMSPVPMRGQRNNSSYISYTAEFIANVRKTDAQSLINKTTENAQNLFSFK